MRFDPALPDERVNVSDTHHVREAFVLVAGITAAGAALSFVLVLAIDLLIPLIPQGIEARVFGGAWVGAALEAADDDGSPDPRARAVAALLARIASHWPDAPYTFRAVLLDEATPNAMAFPGGTIVVTTGLLDRVGSENELAFVLGHELGHFEHRDHLRGLGRALAFGLTLRALGWGSDGGAAQLAALSGELAGRGFDRDQEADADAFGLELLMREYGHVGGATDFFGRLSDPGDTASEAIAHYFATHPLNAERVEALRSLASERGWSAAGTLVAIPLDRDRADPDQP
ncbi:MAG: M48 family metallopeptidase [Myxococcota bacterium]